MEGDDNAPPMARRILIMLLGVAALCVVITPAQAARDLSSIKERVQQVEARAARSTCWCSARNRPP